MSFPFVTRRDHSSKSDAFLDFRLRHLDPFIFSQSKSSKNQVETAL